MIKVGIDGTFLQPESLYTGMGTYTLGLVKTFARLNRQESILLLGDGPRPQVVPEGIRWVRIPARLRGRWGRWLNQQVILPSEVRKLGLDLLHVPGLNMRLSRPGIPFRLPCPLVVTIHDAIPVAYYGKAGPLLPWRVRLGFWLAVWAAKRAQAVITVSETSRADLLRFLPLKEDRLHVIHNGIERPSFPNAGRVEELLAELNLGRPYLLYAGSYEPRKNVLGAVEAYALASNQRELPDMALLVERESGYRDQVMKAVRRRGLGGRLHFLHSLSEEALIALYRGASMLLFPSHYEGFGYPPLLGLACGIPVIASDRGSLPELLGDSVLYVDPDSPSDMSRAVLNLMENPDIAAQFAAHGRAHAQRYQWVEAAERTYQVYMRVIGRASPADDHGSSHHGVRLHEERLDG